MDTPTMSRRDLIRILAALGVVLPAGCGSTTPEPAAPQPPRTVDQLGGTIVFENDKVRVIEHLGKPRLGACGAGMHSHPPHLTIALNAAKVKVTLPGKEPFIVENRAGDAFWDLGGPHMVENIGSSDSKVYLVEIKAA